MRKMRFSIGRLMAFVGVVALGTAGLRNANDEWASACFTLMLLVLVLSVLHAVQSRGRDRAYWTGFAIAGWVYAATLFGPFGSGDVSMNPSLLTQVVIDQLEVLIHPEVAATNVASVSATGMTVPLPSGLTINSATAGSTPISPTTAPAPLPSTVVNAPAPIQITGNLNGTVVGGGVTPAGLVAMPTPPSITGPTFAFAPGDTIRIAYSQVAHSLSALVAGMLGGLYSTLLLARRERREATTAADDSPPHL